MLLRSHPQTATGQGGQERLEWAPSMAYKYRSDKLAETVQASIGQAEYNDLDFVAGTWLEDADTTKALKEQCKIDKDMWQ